jgi:hypothetical protein
VGRGPRLRLAGPGASAAIRILDLSAGGGRLLVPPDLADLLERVAVHFELGTCPPFRGRVSAVWEKGERQRLQPVGVRFHELGQVGLGSLSRFLVERYLEQRSSPVRRCLRSARSFVHTGAGRVRRLLGYHLLDRCVPFEAYAGDEALGVRLRGRSLSEDGSGQVLLAEVLDGEAERLEPGRRYSFVFRVAGALSLFPAVVERVASGNLRLRLPERIHQGGFRSSPRTRLAVEQGLTAVLHHPRIAGRVLHKPILDIGGGGLSFPLDPERDLLAPGDRIDELELNLPGSEIRARAGLRGISRQVDGDELHCGLELLDFPRQADREAWNRFVFHASHSRLRLGDRRTVDSVYQVLENSGYTDLVDPDLRRHQRRRFFRAWSAQADCNALGRHFLLVAGANRIGTVAASSVYPDTWLVHHLGIDRRSPEVRSLSVLDLAREMYSGMIYILQYMARPYFLSYFDADKDFNDLIYSRFLANYPEAAHFLYDRFRLYKCRPDPGAADAAPAAGVRVSPADPLQRQRIGQHLVERLPAIEVDAFRLDPERIALQAFRDRCSQQGIQRERALFAAERGGCLRVALIAETGDEGTNIFGLLNRCWLVPLDAAAMADRDLLAALLRRVQAHYAAAGKPEFVLLGRGDEPAELLAGLGYEHRADGLRWLARREILAPWRSYLEQTLQMLEHRKARHG